jgi:hypothetical protein
MNGPRRGKAQTLAASPMPVKLDPHHAEIHYSGVVLLIGCLSY